MAQKILEFVGIVTLIANIVLLVAWGALQPTARYEQAAFERLEAAKKAYQLGRYEEAFARYDDVVNNFSGSKYSDRALFLAGRTALKGLGQVSIAHDRFRAYVDRHPRGDYREATDRYLRIIEAVPDSEGDRKDSVVWELIQAEREFDRGDMIHAINRCHWLKTYYGNTRIAYHAEQMATAIKQQASLRYAQQGGAASIETLY